MKKGRQNGWAQVADVLHYPRGLQRLRTKINEESNATQWTAQSAFFDAKITPFPMKTSRKPEAEGCRLQIYPAGR
jgi:hypothetical protein